MWFLKTFGYRVIHLDRLYEIKTGRSRPQGREIVITFDDGNETYLQYALPILERYQIPSANFLIWNNLEQGEHGSMSLEDAKRLSAHPLVTLGSHTLSHPNLLEVSEASAKKEIFESKENLEGAFHQEVGYLSYPGGHCNQEIIGLAKEAGYRLAFTTSRKRLGGLPETTYSLTRMKVTPQQNLFVFWLNISGFTHLAKEIDYWLHFRQLTANSQSGTLHGYEQRLASV